MQNITRPPRKDNLILLTGITAAGKGYYYWELENIFYPKKLPLISDYTYIKVAHDEAHVLGLDNHYHPHTDPRLPLAKGQTIHHHLNKKQTHTANTVYSIGLLKERLERAKAMFDLPEGKQFHPLQVHVIENYYEALVDLQKKVQQDQYDLVDFNKLKELEKKLADLVIDEPLVFTDPITVDNAYKAFFMEVSTIETDDILHCVEWAGGLAQFIDPAHPAINVNVGYEHTFKNNKDIILQDIQPRIFAVLNIEVDDETRPDLFIRKESSDIRSAPTLDQMFDSNDLPNILHQFAETRVYHIRNRGLKNKNPFYNIEQTRLENFFIYAMHLISTMI